MRLYHTSNVEIRVPDLKRGRKNADFGQGFYLTPDEEFARRWAAADAILNTYELEEAGLSIHRFSRDEKWYSYIFGNRRTQDPLRADVVAGPIANDTIFETFGIISSGFLQPSEALRLLMIGPEYTQVVIKTPKAAENLRWISAEQIGKQDSSLYQAEREAYIAAFAQVMQEIAGE
ncbi:MAG: DUF3990 domain-containing protein [Lachnospiraceae bacterium]|nr:DUF3990 domain-containing protein [Lachnospiraceae bacterium]